MKIVREFVAGRQEGWIPYWMPAEAGFSDTDGRFLVHDILEHRLCDTGLVHEEAMAFGRMIAVRHETGLIDNYGRDSREFVAGRELAGLFLDDGEQGLDMKMAPEAETPTDIRDGLAEFLRGFRMGMRDDAADRGWEHFDMPRGFYASLARWVVIGYRDAWRRYGRRTHHVGHLVHYHFTSDKGTPKSSEDGNLLMRVTVDVDANTCRHAVWQPWELPERKLDRLATWRHVNDRYAPY